MMMFVKPKEQVQAHPHDDHDVVIPHDFILRVNRESVRYFKVQGNNKSHNIRPIQYRCGICFDGKPLSEMFSEGNCNHRFCTHCISKYTATQIHQNILKVICPDPDCNMELKPEHLKTILPKEVIVRWERVRCEPLMVGLDNPYCPYKDCSALLVNHGQVVTTTARCTTCYRLLLCAQCKAPWHPTIACKEFQRVRRNQKKLDKKFFNLAKEEHWKKCPNCNMFIQRRDGCEHISCRCGCDFCYTCGKRWNARHECKTMKKVIYNLRERTVKWFRRANLRFLNGSGRR